MIVDHLDRIARYRGMHKNLDLLIDAISQLDFDQLPEGRHELHGEAVFLNLMNTKLTDHSSFEAHRNYIDLQLVLKGVERIDYAPLEDFRQMSPYDEGRDIQQSTEELPHTPCLLSPGMFAIFFPEDAHRPGLGQGEGRKAVFKIRVD